MMVSSGRGNPNGSNWIAGNVQAEIGTVPWVRTDPIRIHPPGSVHRIFLQNGFKSHPEVHLTEVHTQQDNPTPARPDGIDPF